MAKVQNISGDDLEVRALGRVVRAGDVVTVPDELFESLVPLMEKRSKSHPWAEIEAPAPKTINKRRGGAESKES